MRLIISIFILIFFSAPVFPYEESSLVGFVEDKKGEMNLVMKDSKGEKTISASGCPFGQGSRIVWDKEGVFGVQDRFGNLFNFYNPIRQAGKGVKITTNAMPQKVKFNSDSFKKFVDDYKPVDTSYRYKTQRVWINAAGCGEVLNICYSGGKVFVCTKENGLLVCPDRLTPKTCHSRRKNQRRS